MILDRSKADRCIDANPAGPAGQEIGGGARISRMPGMPYVYSVRIMEIADAPASSRPKKESKAKKRKGKSKVM